MSMSTEAAGRETGAEGGGRADGGSRFFDSDSLGANELEDTESMVSGSH